MRRCRYQVCEKTGFFAAGLNRDNRVIGRMPAGDDTPDAGQQLARAIDQFELAAALEGLPVFRQIAGPAARVWRIGDIKLAALGIINSVGKRGHDLAASIAARVPADVVEVHVRHDYMRDLLRRHALFRQPVDQRLLAVDGKHLREARIEFIADPRIHQHRSLAGADQQGVQSHQNPVCFIRRLELLPEHLRHHAKHGAAIETKQAVGDQIELYVSKLHAYPEFMMILS